MTGSLFLCSRDVWVSKIMVYELSFSPISARISVAVLDTLEITGTGSDSFSSSLSLGIAVWRPVTSDIALFTGENSAGSVSIGVDHFRGGDARCSKSLLNNDLHVHS